MTREKRAKTKIKRRSAGLVITPPVPRPVASDHPARLLFRDAIESAKASHELDLTETRSTQTNEPEEVRPTSGPPETDSAVEVVRAAPLQIFKELQSQSDTVRREKPLPPPPAVESVHRREHLDAFEGHFGQWRAFLSEAQMKILEALYNMTHALGTDHCMTSMTKLAAAAGVSERQTYYVVKELEKYGFVERPDTFNTPTKKGTIFRLHITRRMILSSADRRYHYGD